MTTDLLLPDPAHALGALLDVPVPDLAEEGLPLLWHWLYLLDRPAQADLGPDGHPFRNTVPVPPSGRRRMWAGGRVRRSGPLRCGETATRETTVLSTEDKQGRSGPLTFVVVRHQIWQRGEVVVEEEQDLVYREPGTTPDLPETPEVPAAEHEWAVDVTPTLLFRFSALTYNAHRIHYDRDYARDVEGYPGLLTHGPLQALAMAEAGRRAGLAGDFEYRLVAPLFDHQGMVVTPTSVRDRYGRRTATGGFTGAPR
ncbi:FAS1-like dehydratase domain-containing protein [Lentzea chajnantorensis]